MALMVLAIWGILNNEPQWHGDAEKKEPRRTPFDYAQDRHRAQRKEVSLKRHSHNYEMSRLRPKKQASACLGHGFGRQTYLIRNRTSIYLAETRESAEKRKRRFQLEVAVYSVQLFYANNYYKTNGL